MRDKLSDMMEPDIIVRVFESGEVAPQHYGGLWAPDLSLEVDAEGQLLPGWDDELRAQATRQDWSLMRGYSGGWLQGQSVLMDPGEYVGGRMADDILAAPGVYVVVDVTCGYSGGEPVDGGPCGWVVAYRHEGVDGGIPGTPDPSRWWA
jgi:hypothetical protein